jgi:hypothetical protein
MCPGFARAGLMDSEPVSAICTPAFSGRSPWEDHRNSRAGHRAACPAQHHGGTVRHTSVNPATQGPAAPRDDIPRDRQETARIAAEMQRAGRLSMWWQVLGSNQRRFSRRFSARRSYPRCTPLTSACLEFQQACSLALSSGSPDQQPYSRGRQVFIPAVVVVLSLRGAAGCGRRCG